MVHFLNRLLSGHCIVLNCAYSPFFRSALQGNFTESLSEHLVLEGDDPEGFGDMIDWLYTGKLPTARLYNEREPLENLGFQWYRLNILAHKRFVSELEDETMIQIRSCLQNRKWPPSWDEIKLVYENSDHSSEIRSLLLECQMKAYFAFTEANFEEQIPHWTEVTGTDINFLCEVMKAVHYNRSLTESQCTLSNCSEVHRNDEPRKTKRGD